MLDDADEMSERTFFGGGPGKNIHDGDGNVWMVVVRGMANGTDVGLAV